MDSHLHISPEYEYMDIFRDIIHTYLSEAVSAAPGLLSADAEAGLEKAFWDTAFLIAGDTLEKMQSEIIARDNPLVVYDRKLSTRKQKEGSALILKEMLQRKEQILPENLYQVLHSRFRILAAALSEMLENIVTHRKKAADVLFEGKEFTRIEKIEAGAGDYHNYARAATVIETDAGKMIYKPHNCLADVRTRIFVQKYFPGCILIPKCYTDGSSFGICEYLVSAPAEGDAGARKWFYALGELTVLAQLLGSYDMHYENIIASKGLPAIIDLETILHPWIEPDAEQVSDEGRPEFRDDIMFSIWHSYLLPRTMNGMQVSVLLRTEGADSCAPVVDGNPVTVFDHSEEYFTGLESAYRRCLSQKSELEKDVKELFSDVPVRLIMRNTQSYNDLRQMLYKAGELSSEEAYAAFSARVEKALMLDCTEEVYRKFCHSEAEAVLRGDIPYFYTLGDSHDVYDADGNLGKMIRKSAVEGSLQRISRMSEQELMYEKKLIKETFAAGLVKSREHARDLPAGKSFSLPERASEELSGDLAVQEAEKIMNEICSRMIQAPNGTFGWIGSNGAEGSPDIMQAGLFTGTTGIGVFAAAMAASEISEEVREAAEKCERTAIYDLERMLDGLKGIKNQEAAKDLANMPGESSGMAGLLSGLCLMNRYSGCDRYRDLTDQGMELLKITDISAVTGTDRIGGLAGIISVLCRYPELNRTEQGKSLIAAFADRLIDLKQFQADGRQLWETVSKRHIISGAGHGMAGIGEALYAAGRMLGNNAYLGAAVDALRYEEQVFSEKLGTWPDNRIWPAQSYMHGYCSGAPGIGMLMHGILKDQAECHDPDQEYRFSEICGKCAEMAEKAVDTLPLLYRDHLCCGNSSIAEYYLVTGKRKEAGRILNSMITRKEKTGTYMTVPPEYRKIHRLSLFFGIAGIGYELLRYAYPDRIHSIIC